MRDLPLCRFVLARRATTLRLFLFALITLWPAALGFAADAAGLIVEYLHRRHQLAPNDIQGRLELAQWCATGGLMQQQVDVLVDVLKLQPGHPTAYDRLLTADAEWNRPVDRQWAQKLGDLLGDGFRLHHCQHFTILHDGADSQAAAFGQAMEDLYRTYYRDMTKIGLTPLPPGGRLVSVLFAKVDSYQDFLARYEGVSVSWAAGYYSWRTNRVVLFDDRDNPLLAQVRQRLERMQQQIAQLRAEVEQLKNAGGSGLPAAQAKLRRLLPDESSLRQRLETLTDRTTLEKLRHEVTHQLLANSGLQRRGQSYPFWLGEGLAMCFEPAGAPAQSGPAAVNSDRQKTYGVMRKSEGLLSLEKLLTTRPGDNEPVEKVAGLYSQAWALVHFLWREHPEQLRQYITAISGQSRPSDGLKLFRECFGNDLAALEGDLRRAMDR